MEPKALITRFAPRLLLAAAGVAAILVSAGSATAMGQYVDARGDSGAAPDITGAVVVNLAGQLTVSLRIKNAPASQPALVELFIDSDANPATGAPGSAGADYVLVSDESDDSWSFGHWIGSDWDWDTPWSTVRVITLPSAAVAFSVNRSELSNTSVMNIWARTEVGEGGDGNSDTAPDVGLWNYSLRLDGPEIRGIVTATKPAAGPKAGKPFTVAVTGVKLPPDGEPTPTIPRPDKYRCAAKLAGRPLRGRGTGGCSFALPKSARGKRLMVVVTVEYGGTKRTTQLSYRVS